MVLSAMLSWQRLQAATKSKLGRLRRACGANMIVTILVRFAIDSVLCRTYDIHLELSCSTQENKGTRSHQLVALALHGAREKLRRAIGPQGGAASCAFFSLCGTMVHGTVRALHFFSTGANPVSFPLRLCCETEQV